MNKNSPDLIKSVREEKDKKKGTQIDNLDPKR